jgi:hypothetical protein
MAKRQLGLFGPINAGMGILFLISAVLQYNDPDPIRWILLWGSAAAVCLLRGRVGWDWLMAGAVCAAALLWAGLLAPTALPGLELGDLAKKMKAGTPRIELGREILGLLIVAVWMAVLVFVGSRNADSVGSGSS